MTAPAIRFDRVTFTFPEEDSAVLQDVSFEIAEGTFVLVTGDTGSGKSTLLRAANGLVPHFTGGRWDGAVSVHGRNTLDAAPRYLSDLVAFVPQDPAASFVVDRVEDELAYAMENLETAPATMRRRVEETLDLLDIERLRDRSVRSLSGGEKQRVAIAAALTPGPRILLLDEPTSQLDPGGAEDVLAALQRMVHDLGLTVIIAEHRLERVAGFVDRAIGCHGHGRVSIGNPREVLAEVGTGPPVTVVARLAGWDTIPLTVREARRAATEIPPLRENEGASTVEPPASAWLEVEGVTASYGREVALEDVCLTAGTGEIVAIVGRNGAGKTTLLRCITGLHDPLRGHVSLAGEPPRPGQNVALTPQNPEAVLFKDTVAAEIAATTSVTEARTDAELLGRLGLEGLAEHHPRDLSAGQRLLVAVAAIAATGAPLLLLDEPTRGLDPYSKDALTSLLRHHAVIGIVMFATHDVELVAAVATRVIMLAGGEVVADGSPSEILGDSTVFAPQMARVFGPRWLTPRQVAAALRAPA